MVIDLDEEIIFLLQILQYDRICSFLPFSTYSIIQNIPDQLSDDKEGIFKQSGLFYGQPCTFPNIEFFHSEFMTGFTNTTPAVLILKNSP